MIAQTSLLAYKEIFYKLSPREAEVINVIRNYEPIDNLGIADALDLPINSVTGRTNSLAQPQVKLSREVRPSLIEVDHVGLNRYGNKAKFWRVKE